MHSCRPKCQLDEYKSQNKGTAVLRFHWEWFSNLSEAFCLAAHTHTKNPSQWLLQFHCSEAAAFDCVHVLAHIPTWILGLASVSGVLQACYSASGHCWAHGAPYHSKKKWEHKIMNPRQWAVCTAPGEEETSNTKADGREWAGKPEHSSLSKRRHRQQRSNVNSRLEGKLRTG